MAVKDIRAVLKKYRGAVLVLLCGIALMCLPRQQETKKHHKISLLQLMALR